MGKWDFLGYSGEKRGEKRKSVAVKARHIEIYIIIYLHKCGFCDFTLRLRAVSGSILLDGNHIFTGYGTNLL